jgi:hypothetical protein
MESLSHSIIFLQQHRTFHTIHIFLICFKKPVLFVFVSKLKAFVAVDYRTKAEQHMPLFYFCLDGWTCEVPERCLIQFTTDINDDASSQSAPAVFFFFQQVLSIVALRSEDCRTNLRYWRRSQLKWLLPLKQFSLSQDNGPPVPRFAVRTVWKVSLPLT